jgi:TRAP-type C4-dicarboxylate transport system permease small subunit
MAEERSALARSCDTIAWAVERVLALGLIVAILFNVINVAGRYVTGFTLTGVDEVEIYLLIWIAFLNAAVVSWRRDHLRMDLIVKALPMPLQRAIYVFEAVVLLAVTAFVGYYSFLYVQRIFRLGIVSDMAHVPTWIPHSAVFIGFGLMALIALYRGIALLRRARPVQP